MKIYLRFKKEFYLPFLMRTKKKENKLINEEKKENGKKLKSEKKFNYRIVYKGIKRKINKTVRKVTTKEPVLP